MHDSAGSRLQITYCTLEARAGFVVSPHCSSLTASIDPHTASIVAKPDDDPTLLNRQLLPLWAPFHALPVRAAQPFHITLRLFPAHHELLARFDDHCTRMFISVPCQHRSTMLINALQDAPPSLREARTLEGKDAIPLRAPTASSSFGEAVEQAATFARLKIETSFENCMARSRPGLRHSSSPREQRCRRRT